MIHLKLFVRKLLRNPTFSIVTILGYGVSFSVILLISAYVINEYSYDSFYPSAERIYKIVPDTVPEHGYQTTIDEDLKVYLDEQVYEITQVSRFLNINWDFPVFVQNNPYSVNGILFTENTFLDLFDIKFLEGSKETALDLHNNIILTERIAKKLFGDQDPIGKTVNVRSQFDLTVSGLIEDFPQNSSFQPEIIAHRESGIANSKRCNYNECTILSSFFILLSPNADIEIVESKIEKISAEHDLEINSINLEPLKDSYTHVGLRDGLPHINIELVQVLSLVGLFILLISVLNFIILYSAHLITRMKEISIRKTFGTTSKRIFIQFIIEAISICLISFFVGIIFAEMSVTIFERMINKSIHLKIFYDMNYLVILILGIIVLGIISGFIPAFIYSRYQSYFKDIYKRVNRLKIKSGLSVVQYAISISLIVCLVIISRQVNFIKTKDYGFDKDYLIKINGSLAGEKLAVFKQQISTHNHIISACKSDGVPGEFMIWSSWRDLQDIGYKSQIPTFYIGNNFFEVFNAELLYGRYPRETEIGCLINESLFNLFDWKDFEGKELMDLPVIGVLKDFHVENLYSEILPAIFIIDSEQSNIIVTARISSSDIPATLIYLKKTWKDIFPNLAFDYVFYDEWINAMYKSEERLAYSIKFFTILAILISGMGTFAVAQYISRQRTKEIGIRKVNGASIKNIMVLLNRNFTVWVIIAFIISTPVSYYLMNKWLENFAYKTMIPWWVFVLAGCIALIISILTVTWQSWQAARRNPVEVLRYE